MYRVFILLLISSTVLGQTPIQQSGCLSADCKYSFQLPLDSVSLNSSFTSTTSTLKAISWIQLSGPTITKINNPTAAKTMNYNMNLPGTYIYQVTATTNQSVTLSALDTVIVLAANPPPVLKTLWMVTQTITTTKHYGSASNDSTVVITTNAVYQ